MLVGLSGRQALNKYFTQIIDQNNIDFTIINGENAADDGKGIPRKIAR